MLTQTWHIQDSQGQILALAFRQIFQAVPCSLGSSINELVIRRFESLILSNHSRLTCECDEEKINDDE